jgi:hypothetical protein
MVKLVGEYKSDPKVKNIKHLIMSLTVEGIPWGFFDGASQVHLPLCDVGALFFLTKHTIIISYLSRVQYQIKRPNW